jgi:mannosyltransferase OCH1-like enzyme
MYVVLNRMMHRKSAALIILLVIIALTIILYTLQPVKETFETANNHSKGNVPKHIWTYWDDPSTIPKTVHFCMETWKKHNPDYIITLLTKANYKNYTSIPDSIANHPNMNDMKQRFADLIRLYVIAEHGGVWVDSSTFMNQPIDSWLYSERSDADFYGFTIVYNYKRPLPIIENWFFAAPPENPFIIAWRDEFSRLTQYENVSAYIESLRKEGVDLNWDGPEYLAQHSAAQRILQLKKYPVSRMSLRPAEEGPFKYLVDNKWDSSVGIKKACEDPTLRNPFMKLRGPDRATFEHGLNTDYSNDKCKWL